MTLGTSNLACYRTPAVIPLAALIPGLQAGKLRLGKRPGQVCVAAGATPYTTQEQQKERRDYARKVNQAILEASETGRALLAAWEIAKDHDDPAGVLAAAMAGTTVGPAPATVAPGTNAKPQKPRRTAKTVVQTVATAPAPVFSLDDAGTGIPVAEPATPIQAATQAARVAHPGFADPVVLTADMAQGLSDLSAVVVQLGRPVTLEIGGVAFRVTPA